MVILKYERLRALINYVVKWFNKKHGTTYVDVAILKHRLTDFSDYFETTIYDYSKNGRIVKKFEIDLNRAGLKNPIKFYDYIVEGLDGKN